MRVTEFGRISANNLDEHGRVVFALSDEHGRVVFVSAIISPPAIKKVGVLLEVHESNGGALICILENAYNIAWSQRINELDILTFSLPSGDPKASELVGGREIWLYRRS